MWPKNKQQSQCNNSKTDNIYRIYHKSLKNLNLLSRLSIEMSIEISTGDLLISSFSLYLYVINEGKLGIQIEID